MNKIKKGDDVIVIAGKDKGKRGNVLSVLENGRVMVDGVNIVKKHVRPNPQAGETGGIVEQEAAMDISNVALYDAATGKASRVSIKTLEDGKKVRIYKTSGEMVDV
jgi:large subunit ribosomal protein L24